MFSNGTSEADMKHRLNSAIGLYKVGTTKTESLTTTLFNCANVVATVCWQFIVPTHAVWAGVAQNWATTFAQLNRVTVSELVFVG